MTSAATAINDSLNDNWNRLANSLLAFETIDCRDRQESRTDLANAVKCLSDRQFFSVLIDWYYDLFNTFITDELVPQFWQNFRLPPDPESTTNTTTITSLPHNILFEAIDELYRQSTKWINNQILNLVYELSQPTETVDQLPKLQTRMKNQLRSILMAEIPINFNEYLMKTYSLAFSVNQFQKNKQRMNNNTSHELSLLSSTNDSIEMDDTNTDNHHNNNNNKCFGCHQIQCLCQQIADNFIRFNHQLSELSLIEVLSGDAITSVMHSCIEKHIYQSCKDNFEVSCICNLKKWIDNTVINWIRFVCNDLNGSQLANLEERLTHFLYETYAACRMDQIFDITIQMFPESEPSLIDLRECLEKCANFRPKLIRRLKESLESRLLHPGVSTTDIIEAYISTIKALRVVDPTDVILQLVCEPVRKYLKSRDDTVRCIITALTDESSSELTPEFVKGNIDRTDDTNGGQNGNGGGDDDNIGDNWQQWVPINDPIDSTQHQLQQQQQQQESNGSSAAAAAVSKSLRNSDIVSILVNIYESKDLFVEEYQRLLAQRLLTNFDCNVEHERRNLELLTLRFGESDLHACEVMLKDVKESERINQRINSGEISEHHFNRFPINSLILSAQFWPEKLGLGGGGGDDLNGLKLPPDVQSATECYTRAFETIKGSRTLNWLSHLGLVRLELSFSGGKTLHFAVPPIQATIIWHFAGDRTEWSISELSEAMSIPPSILRRRITLWQNKGILKETTTDRFVLVEDDRIVASNPSATVGPAVGGGSHDLSTHMNMENDFDDDLTDDRLQGSAVDEREEKLNVYWSFVLNMLQNLNSLTIERIHQMLQMFAIQPNDSHELTAHELRHFLDSKVREHKLVYSNGQYRLSDTN
ncbi:anaphase-promoting complex subunit 2-like [Oppia nitens]|uniref:anaphase-promoting complex subunit 2-like n=1 Tax=Oppia nitens TaxID=1686743 RepID=UPI0023DBA117|nr:anaphase-promoting complex subunit 2-like [Oppia nitens]